MREPFCPAAMKLLWGANAARRIKSPNEIQEIAAAIMLIDGGEGPAAEVRAMREAIRYGTTANMQETAPEGRAAEILRVIGTFGRHPVYGPAPQA